MKKANASSANGRPITAPHRPISPGQNSPSANDSTVPRDRADREQDAEAPSPTADVSAIHTGSPVRFARYSANSSITGRPTPSAANTMWNAERDGHLCSGRLERGQRDDDHPGGDERTRTADPLLAKQVLYQLSYVPVA